MRTSITIYTSRDISDNPYVKLKKGWLAMMEVESCMDIRQEEATAFGHFGIEIACYN